MFSRQSQQPSKDVEAVNFRKYQDSRATFLRVRAHGKIIIVIIGIMTATLINFPYCFLYAIQSSKCFTCIHSFHPHKQVHEVVLLFPFYS